MKRKSSITRTFKIILITVLVILVGLLILFLLTKKEPIESSVSTSKNLMEHPLYSQYQFNMSDSVVNIGIQPLYLPTGIIFEVIKRDQIFKKEMAALGKEVNYYPFFKGTDVNFFMGQGLINGGVGGDMPALTAAINMDIIIPMVIQKGEVSIMARETLLTNDMIGKRIAYPEGSISHYFILELLQSLDITHNDVTLIPMEVSTMAEALRNNEIDLYSTWEPNVTLAIEKYPEFKITYKQMAKGYIYFTEVFYDNNPEVVDQLLAAIIRAVSWIKTVDANLLLASEWNIETIEEFTGDSYLLDNIRIAHLAEHDIFLYPILHGLIPNDSDLEQDGLLHNEYDFILSMNKKAANKSWEQVRNSFNSGIADKIMHNPKKFKLDSFDYNLSEEETKKVK